MAGVGASLMDEGEAVPFGGIDGMPRGLDVMEHGGGVVPCAEQRVVVRAWPTSGAKDEPEIKTTVAPWTVSVPDASEGPLVSASTCSDAAQLRARLLVDIKSGVVASYELTREILAEWPVVAAPVRADAHAGRGGVMFARLTDDEGRTCAYRQLEAAVTFVGAAGGAEAATDAQKKAVAGLFAGTRRDAEGLMRQLRGVPALEAARGAAALTVQITRMGAPDRCGGEERGKGPSPSSGARTLRSFGTKRGARERSSSDEDDGGDGAAAVDDGIWDESVKALYSCGVRWVEPVTFVEALEMEKVFTSAVLEFMGGFVAAAVELATVVLGLTTDVVRRIMFSTHGPRADGARGGNGERAGSVDAQCAFANEYLHRDRHNQMGEDLGLRGDAMPGRCSQMHINLSLLVHMLTCDPTIIALAQSAH